MKNSFQVWVQLNVSKESRFQIHDFFKQELKVNPSLLFSRLHLTVYHCGVLMDVNARNENCHYDLDTSHTRFMVMTPGGENTRYDALPSKNKSESEFKKSHHYINP